MRRPRLEVLALTAALACAPEPAATPLEVVARAVSPSAIRPHGVALDGEVRRGLSRPFELPGTGGEQLVFSIGLRDSDEAARARFSVRAREQGGWRELFAETLTSGGDRWHDRSLALDGAGRLRFEAALEAGPGVPVWGSPLVLGRRADEDAPRPNVILLLLDTLGASYLSAYGGLPGVSPNLDAFLEGSFWFQRAYAQYAMTLSSVMSLVTGLYPARHGIYGGSAGGHRFDSLIARVAEAGYLTEAITEGGYVSSLFGFARAFDRYDNGDPDILRATAGAAPRTFAKAKTWLETWGRDARFFLLVHTYEVHSPYLPRRAESRRIVERITPDDLSYPNGTFQNASIFKHNAGRKLFSAPDLEHMKALHIATVHELDQEVGAFLRRLDELGLADDALVVLASDHGEQFGEHGKVGHGDSLHNRALHVPLAFRWPSHIRPGASDALVQLVDVMPTILELLGLAPPDGIDGRSLAPWVRGGAQPEQRPAFSELRGSHTECIRLGLPKECRLDRYAVQSERFKLVTSAVPRGEALFDLEEDSLESRDVAAQHPEVAERLRGLLQRYRSAARATTDAAAPPALDEETQRRLETLGYLP